MSLLTEALLLPLSLEGKIVEKETLKNILSDLNNLVDSIPSNVIVLLQEKDPLRFMMTFFCLLERGHLPVVLPTDFSDFQLEQVRSHLSHPFCLINGNLRVGTIQKVPYSNCYASLTSGTTGRPKLCFLNVQNARRNALAHCESLAICESDEVIQTLPLYHSYGIVVYLFGWLEKKFKLDLNSTFLGLRALNKRTLYNAVLNISPAQLRFMLKEKGPAPEGLKCISVGGGSIDQQSIEDFSKKLPGVKLYLTYGLTEAGPRVSTGLWNGEEAGFIGKAIRGVSVKVLIDGKVCEEGIGKLLVSSSMLKLNLDENECHGEYLLTRDLVRLDKTGKIYFKTRDDDLINYGGISIYPLDIETVTKMHPDVLDAQVIKGKSVIYEEEPVLFIEPKLDVEVIRDFLKEKLTVYQMPKKIITLDKLPRTSLNKVDRSILKSIMEST